MSIQGLRLGRQGTHNDAFADGQSRHHAGIRWVAGAAATCTPSGTGCQRCATHLLAAAPAAGAAGGRAGRRQRPEARRPTVLAVPARMAPGSIADQVRMLLCNFAPIIVADGAAASPAVVEEQNNDETIHAQPQWCAV